MSNIKIVYEIPKWYKLYSEMYQFGKYNRTLNEKIESAKNIIYDLQYGDGYRNELIYYKIVVLDDRVFIYRQKRGKIVDEPEK